VRPGLLAYWKSMGVFATMCPCVGLCVQLSRGYATRV
jgi:hypothetical protein